jgi:Caspase domain
MAKVALLIGVGEYGNGLSSLTSAPKDVEAIHEVLENPAIGGFDQVTSLINPERQAMEEAIYTLFANRKKDDLLLLFFSGHGVKDDSGNLYLAAHNTRKDVEHRLKDSNIPPIARKLLDLKRDSLQLTPEEAAVIETEVLKPYREYEAKLQQYEQVLSEAIQAENPIRQVSGRKQIRKLGLLCLSYLVVNKKASSKQKIVDNYRVKV